MLKKILILALLFIISVLGLTFALQNPGNISLKYYFDINWQAPITIVLLLTLIIGFLLSTIINVIRIAKLKRQLRAAKNKL